MHHQTQQPRTTSMLGELQSVTPIREQVTFREAATDLETRRLLRILGQVALRLSDGQPVDPSWIQQQFSSTANDDMSTVRTQSTLLTVPEACARLRISRWSLYQLIHQHRLVTVTIGRRRLVPGVEIERFVGSLAATEGQP
jgi:excisionase family DNA binding protein